MFYHLDYDNEIDMNSIQYTNPKKSSGGSYISQCYFTNDEGSNVPIILETPEFEFSELKNIKNKTYLPIEYSEETGNFFEFIKQLKNYNIQYASQNSSKWFRKNLSVSHMEDYHCNLIENIEETPTINLLLVSKNDNIEIDIQDFNNESLDISQLSNRKVKCIVKIDTLKFLRQELVCILSVIKIQAQKENVIDLIKDDNESELVINNFDQSVINFTEKTSNMDTNNNGSNEEEYTEKYIEDNEKEYNDKNKDEDTDEEKELKESLENLEIDELEPLNMDNLGDIENIDIEDYNNFEYEDEEHNNDEEYNNKNNEYKNEELEKRIAEYNNSIMEAENEYNRNLQSLNEQEKLLAQKKNEFEELKKEKISNEKQCYF